MGIGKMDDDEIEFNTQADPTTGTVTITTDNGAANQYSILPNSNVTLNWDESFGQAVFSGNNDELNEIKQQFQEYKNQMNARIAELEDQVVLVRRDVLLEEDFEELKEAWDTYNELLQKLKTFKALQDSA